MKKNLSAAVFLLAASANAFAQTSAKDSLRVVNLQEVQVVSTRATSKTPVAYSNISQKEIQKQNQHPCTRNRCHTHQHYRQRDPDE